MKIEAFVPVRSGSKGLPGKNIREFCGKPLLYWITAELLKVEKIDKVIIAIDCKKYEEIIKKEFSRDEGGKLSIFRRSSETVKDDIHWEAAVIEYINSDMHLEDQDILIMAQATSPFIRKEQINEALELFYRNFGKRSIVTAARTHRFIWEKYGESNNGIAINYDFRKRPRRQDFEGTLVENGAFCINTVGRIFQDNNRLSAPVAVYEMPSHTYTEIDNADDWFYAEYLFRKYELGPRS